MLAPSLSRTLASLSADEMLAALRLTRAPLPLRGAAWGLFRAISIPLGQVLARFDARIESMGPASAAAAALDDLGATLARTGPAPPATGTLLVVSNHPGAYDALALLAALGRDDVKLVAADRTFLRAMPALARHLCFVPERADRAHERAGHLRAALRHLRGGGALVQFGAGRIEPDPAFALPAGDERLAPWQPGTGAMVRGAAAADGQLVVALAMGVHSPRAKRLRVTRMAEQRGVTTLAPLLQIAVPRFHDVAARVAFAPAVLAETLAAPGDDAAITSAVRERALSLWPAGPPG